MRLRGFGHPFIRVQRFGHRPDMLLGHRSPMLHSAREAALALLEDGRHEHACVLRTLSKFGVAPLRFAGRHGIRVVPLARHESYGARSPALRRLAIDVDAWPAPPAGLFVVEERTVYLRSRSAMTVAHEFGHALDCALGGGIYRSGVDPVLRRLFSQARAFITPYAATGTDEYFAECLRAYVEANDAHSFWPRATRARLARIDSGMFEYVERLFTTELRLTYGVDATCADVTGPALFPHDERM